MSSDERELFKDTAKYYSRYRKGYPKEFFNHLVKEFNLNNNSRLLDLGTGTGQIAIPLAALVKGVVAVDSEQEMLEEGKRIANEKRINNIQWLQMKAEDISNKLGKFNLTTIGAAFHWMNREVVLKRIYELTEDGGGVVIVSDSEQNTTPNQGEDWKEIRREVVAKYLGEKRRAGNSFYEKGEDVFEDRLKKSPFGNCGEWNYDFTRTWTLEEAINFLYSTSFASRRFFGDRLGEFEKELKERLLKSEPSGIFKEEIRLQALIGRKQKP